MAMAALLSAMAGEIGVIEGRFVDTSGASIAGVAVELRESAAGPAWATVKTDESGRFVFPAVPEGTWFLVGKRAGFATGRRGPLKMDAGRRMNLGEIRLELGLFDGRCCECETVPATVRSRSAASPGLKGKISFPRMGEGSSVVLQPISPAGVARTATATWMGDFSFADLPPGTYSLRISAPFHRPFEMPEVTVRRGKASEIDGVIEMPECEPATGCEPVRTVVREKKPRRPVICL